MSEGNKPVHTIRHHRLEAAIWSNQTANGPMYNVTVKRGYKDAAGEWKDAESFGFDDLMNLSKLLSDAHTFISGELRRNKDGR